MLLGYCLLTERNVDKDVIMSKAALYALFGEKAPEEQKQVKLTKEEVEMKLTLVTDNEKKELNGLEAANRAVANCTPDSSIIFLTKSEYQDLLYRAKLNEMRNYKKKTIIIVSDPI
jgi:CheY-like chemotaxis protein